MSALVYELSMPGTNSWNGRWSGEGRPYAIVRTIPQTKKGRIKADAILQNQPYRYRWRDGWCASVSVREVEGRKAATVRRKSCGFCGYDWMVTSIERDGDIYGPDHPKITKEAPQP